MPDPLACRNMLGVLYMHAHSYTECIGQNNNVAHLHSFDQIFCQDIIIIIIQAHELFMSIHGLIQVAQTHEKVPNSSVIKFDIGSKYVYIVNL